MGFLVGMRDVTRHLSRMLSCIAHEREDRNGRVALLLSQHAEIDRARVDARRRTGLQAINTQRQLA
ncbi:hypothetical protein D3C78_1754190 [compost metagenome]